MSQLTRERIDEIVKRYRPKGWRVRESKHRYKSRSALADPARRVFYVPTLCDANALFLFLHECGHVHLRHWHIKQPAHREEFEAERYAANTLRSEGIQLPRWILDDARTRVGMHIEDDERRGIAIQPHVRRWTNGK
jgi:hypothetical protein